MLNALREKNILYGLLFLLVVVSTYGPFQGSLYGPPFQASIKPSLPSANYNKLGERPIAFKLRTPPPPFPLRMRQVIGTGVDLFNIFFYVQRGGDGTTIGGGGGGSG